MARNVDTMQAEGKVEIAAGTFGNIEAMKARVHVPTDQGTDGPQQSRHAEAYSITQGLLGWFSIALAIVLPTKFSKHISILYVPTLFGKLVSPAEQTNPEALHGFDSSKKHQTQSLEAGH